MTQPWPWPDDRFQRRSRIAHMYRDRLAEEAPKACAEIDAVMVAFGQDWITEGLPTDPDELLTVRELAHAADVSLAAVRQWVHRWPLRRRGTTDNGRSLYRWGDVLDHLKDVDRDKQRGE